MLTFWRCKFYYIKYDLNGHARSVRPLLCQNNSSTFVYGPILTKICMNAVSMQSQFFPKIFMIWNVTFMLLSDFYTLRPFDLITTLTYVLMDNIVLVFRYFDIIKWLIAKVTIQTCKIWANFYTPKLCIKHLRYF